MQVKPVRMIKPKLPTISTLKQSERMKKIKSKSMLREGHIARKQIDSTSREQIQKPSDNNINVHSHEYEIPLTLERPGTESIESLRMSKNGNGPHE